MKLGVLNYINFFFAHRYLQKGITNFSA